MSVMRGRGARTWGAVLFTLTALSTGSAAAQGRVAFLADRLQFPPAPGRPDDFRVRLNAALALGATEAEAAISPLCAGLDDPSEAVRQAVALALRRLARSSALSCLERRASVEKKPGVLGEISRAMEAIPATKRAAVNLPASPKVVVSVTKVTNRTKRATAEVDEIVRQAIATELTSTAGYQWVPAADAIPRQQGRPGQQATHAYFLAVRVEKLDDSAEGLRVGLSLTVLSCPGNDLRGEVPAHASLPGARVGDKASEDQLISTAAAHAASLFARNFR